MAPRQLAPPPGKVWPSQVSPPSSPIHLLPSPLPSLSLSHFLPRGPHWHLTELHTSTPTQSCAKVSQTQAGTTLTERTWILTVQQRARRLIYSVLKRNKFIQIKKDKPEMAHPLSSSSSSSAKPDTCMNLCERVCLQRLRYCGFHYSDVSFLRWKKPSWVRGSVKSHSPGRSKHQSHHLLLPLVVPADQ